MDYDEQDYGDDIFSDDDMSSAGFVSSAMCSVVMAIMLVKTGVEWRSLDEPRRRSMHDIGMNIVAGILRKVLGNRFDEEAGEIKTAMTAKDWEMALQKMCESAVASLDMKPILGIRLDDEQQESDLLFARDFNLECSWAEEDGSVVGIRVPGADGSWHVARFGQFLFHIGGGEFMVRDEEPEMEEIADLYRDRREKGLL